LSPKGYKNLEESFFQQTKKKYVKKQFKNRWDSLKKEYTQWKELKIAASGLGWDNKLETVVADPDWWSVHLRVYTLYSPKYSNCASCSWFSFTDFFLYSQKHPEHAKYRNAGPANLAEMHKMFDSRHVTGAQSAIPGETPLEEITEVDDDDTDDEEDDGIKAKRRKRKSKGDDELTLLEEEMVMVRECGVQEGTPLFFSSSMLLMKTEYREMFASVETMQGRFDWLERAHDHL
jgi:hypothetical protein